MINLENQNNAINGTNSQQAPVPRHGDEGSGLAGHMARAPEAIVDAYMKGFKKILGNSAVIVAVELNRTEQARSEREHFRESIKAKLDKTGYACLVSAAVAASFSMKTTSTVLSLIGVGFLGLGPSLVAGEYEHLSF